MKQPRASYYINGINTNAKARRDAAVYRAIWGDDDGGEVYDLPPILRPPTCELQPAPRPASNQAAVLLAVAVVVAIVWLGRLR